MYTVQKVSGPELTCSLTAWKINRQADICLHQLLFTETISLCSLNYVPGYSTSHKPAVDSFSSHRKMNSNNFSVMIARMPRTEENRQRMLFGMLFRIKANKGAAKVKIHIFFFTPATKVQDSSWQKSNNSINDEISWLIK